MIIHIIVYKLFLETVYWNWIAILAGIVSVSLYYITLLIGNSPTIAKTFQPEIMGEFFNMLVNWRFYMLVFVIPGIALLPDVTYLFFKRVFFPSPTDKVMHEQQDFPDYVYEQPEDEQSSPTAKEAIQYLKKADENSFLEQSQVSDGYGDDLSSKSRIVTIH